MSEASQYACPVCRDIGIVECAELDGTGMYEQACPACECEPEAIDDEYADADDGRYDGDGRYEW